MQVTVDPFTAKPKIGSSMKNWKTLSSAKLSPPAVRPSGSPGAGSGSDCYELLAGASAEISELADSAARAVSVIRDALGLSSTQDDRTVGLVMAIQVRTEAFHREACDLAAILHRAQAALPPSTSARDEDRIAAEEISSPTSCGDGSILSTPTSTARRTSFLARREATSCSAKGIRLLATQMAVAGSTRDAIELRLSREFGVLDPDGVLDEIFAQAS